MGSSFIRLMALGVTWVMLGAGNALAKDIPSILLFGDSLMAGYGLPAEQSLATRMSSLFKEKGVDVKVISAAVSGDTTSGGRSRLAWTLKEYSPDVVIFGLGANDMLRGISPAITRQNLDAMLAELTKDKAIKVVFSEVSAPVNMGAQYSSQFNGIYPELAKKYDVPTYPFLLSKIYGKADLMLQDGVHPNAAGVEVIANDLVDFLLDEVIEK
jgi:acyl-CoA thioesterase-1